ncbi:major facilitator superfamily domain-containing protein [Crepidotus variabilis]|uniref:Major facilitator superfamily domain-containing protein n=1 Tax=Crepidotus variabilis TaxID=179855 RepID=A0A9P6EGQ5_9AGAR|nr:major facilitator superfamily domain-containing protein [Crepidotus variabilis]
MAGPSLGAFSTFAIHHESTLDVEDVSALDVTPLPDAYLPGTSTLKSNLRSDLRRLPTYLSDRSRHSSNRSRRTSFSKDDIHMKVLHSDSPEILSQIPSTNNERTSPLEPRHSDARFTDQVALTPQQKRVGLAQFLAVCWSIYLVGWNDGTTGPLLPRIQEQYQLGFTLVSMIFVGNGFGFVFAGALNIWLNDKIGFGKTITLGATCQLVSSLIIATAPPFPVLVSAYVIAGFGLSLGAAQGNGFVGSSRDNMATKMGIFHASYGLGAFCSPLASTYFSTLSNRKWAYHFIISAALSLINVLFLLWMFRLRRQEDILREAGQEIVPDNSAQPGGSIYRQILHVKAVPLMIIFALIYIGVEVTLGGWIVTYIIQKRHGGHSAGYISSGFFGGLTLGRVSLMWLNKLVGEHRIVFVYSLVAIVLQITIWLIPSIIENAVAMSLVGLVLGPIFPLLAQHMTHILPKWLFTGAVGLVTGIGVAGSAALPFITGLLASKYGIGSLQPLMISMMGTMVLVWALIPRTRRVD